MAFYLWVFEATGLAFQSCRHGGVDPDGGDADALTIKAQQTELLNSPYLAVALSGDYRVEVIRWAKGNSYNYDYESAGAYGERDTAFITSDYWLSVRPTVGKDSIRSTMWGTGKGGTLTNHSLGTYAMSRYDGKSYSPPPLDYLFEHWGFGQQLFTEAMIGCTRWAYVDRTELGFGFSIGYVLNKSRADYGQLAIVVPGQDNPGPDRNYQPWASMSFVRRSTGVLLNRK
ncbi:hypothetical protein [Spirosoma sp. KNUC1025]|uniref:hypothetical protein n=1 Tax=Spirosoma sp. KNUC1025 TaxID=2894082 RepID=UPI001E6374FB|nr:hypothetical protein [Spirosoma sp. KNUC1025]UFH57758.1 hypothetical protein LN737_32560 [Spirosoma sp. KNUC1025]